VEMITAPFAELLEDGQGFVALDVQRVGHGRRNKLENLAMNYTVAFQLPI
jgi:hypothetical protein